MTMAESSSDFVIIKCGYKGRTTHDIDIVILLQEKFCLQKVPAGGRCELSGTFCSMTQCFTV